VDEDAGITLSDMKMYIYPSRESVASWGGRGVFMGYYFKWNNDENQKIIEDMGFRRRKGRIEVSYTDYEKLDCLSMNLHDYVKYLKYGYGRATDSACIELRNGTISREEGLRLVERYDGRYPKECIELFCEEFAIGRDRFDELCEPFTNSALFEMNGNTFKRDIDGSLVLKHKFVEKRRAKSVLSTSVSSNR
jgi:hypothetical protein